VIDEPVLPGHPVDRLSGVGPRTAEAFAAQGVHSVLDLLLHLPRRYEDRSRIARLGEGLQVGSWVLVRGRVSDVRVRRISRRRLHIVDGIVDDGSGVLPVVWFNQRWLSGHLHEEQEFYLYGQIREGRGGRLQLVNPEIEKAEGEEAAGLVPVYQRLAKFSGRRLRRLIAGCLPATDACEDPLPENIRRDYRLPRLDDSLRAIHAPELPADERERAKLLQDLNRGRSRAHRRLAFDELLAFACTVVSRRGQRLARKGLTLPRSESSEEKAEELLPFELTAAQRRVLGEIRRDLASGRPMARLVQGDVGAGKTAVAALAMLPVLEAGLQVAMMAPTELLAEQHARTLETILGQAGFPPRLLVASLPAAAGREVREGLARGTVPLVVGTHALFQEAVGFRQLGLAVVDEQHRFGVNQRRSLLAKGPEPHLLVMTATPIPRSLALTVYGDLDLSLIDELPPGRRPVRTVVRPQTARKKVFEFLRGEVKEGGRAFVVCPMIDESEDAAATSLRELEDEVRSLLPGIAVGVLHGRLTAAERETVATSFRQGTLQVLLATTVIEVGVDVPEASVMVIESAQRFGLSQLHQLRGRVGRGSRPSWCILMADKSLTAEARHRLEVICRSSDGFEIADADLEIRGPGELTGTRQWGPGGFRFADIVHDRELIMATRAVAEHLATTGELDEVRERLALYHPVDEVLQAG
jgi:ATP-dependent DNA helicase RecG